MVCFTLFRDHESLAEGMSISCNDPISYENPSGVIIVCVCAIIDSSAVP
jgi:hypothetical protein